MKQKGKWYFTILERLILALALLLAVLPVIYIAANSLKTHLDAYKMPPTLIFKPIPDNYDYLLNNDNFGRYFVNSSIISLSTTVIVITCGTLAAYALRLFRSQTGRRVSNLLLVGRVVPSVTILIPLYVIFNRAGLTGSRLAVILAHTASTMPFITWLLTGFMDDVPQELLDAASMDGCGRMRTLVYIIFPLLLPAVMSGIILAMQYSWNEFIYAFAFTNLRSYTITVGVARYTGGMAVNWGRVGAVACIAFIPIMVVGFVLQKYFIKGMTSGAVKG